MRWSTALVEPPAAVMNTIAFSNASRVMMSRGLISRSRVLRMAVELLDGMRTGANRPTVDHEGWPIHAPHSHDASRHILVASGNGNVGVVPLSVHDGFNRIRNQVA